MIADVMTKGLHAYRFECLREYMGVGNCELKGGLSEKRLKSENVFLAIRSKAKLFVTDVVAADRISIMTAD